MWLQIHNNSSVENLSENKNSFWITAGLQIHRRAAGGADELLATPTCAAAYKQEVEQDSAPDVEDVSSEALKAPGDAAWNVQLNRCFSLSSLKNFEHLIIFYLITCRMFRQNAPSSASQCQVVFYNNLK